MSMLTVNEVAKRWRCCRSTVMSYIKKGRLQSFKTGTHYGIREIWVEEFEYKCQYKNVHF